jgi:uncharacterized repeat protein (TIGR01451 family)
MQSCVMSQVRKALAAAFLIAFAGSAFAQAASAIITKSFAPSTVGLNETSIATITVNNPNLIPLTTVSFNDTMPAGITLITQTGGTCSTLATGGGMFSINPGAGTFSSTSSVLAPSQSCTITVMVRGTVLGTHLNVTSTVTSNEAPPGGAASAALNVVQRRAPTLSASMLMALAAILAGMAMLKLRA